LSAPEAVENGVAIDESTDEERPAQYPSLAALIILALCFRLTALFLVDYGGSSEGLSDFRYYHDLAALSAQGYYPGIHFWTEYPPVFPRLAVAAYRLTVAWPTWTQPYFWFDLVLTFILGVVDAGSIVAIDRIGDAYWGSRAGRRSAAIYAALIAPVWAVLGWFDVLPTFFLLAALALVVSRPVPSNGARSSPSTTPDQPRVRTVDRGRPDRGDWRDGQVLSLTGLPFDSRRSKSGAGASFHASLGETRFDVERR
jgi:hypothetical protein